MSRDPHREIQEKWIICKKHWEKINKVMKDIGLPKLDTPKKFMDLSDIVESHAKQYSLWTKQFTKMTDARLVQVQRFAKHPIKARTMP
jgi:hypothetical protein